VAAIFIAAVGFVATTHIAQQSRMNRLESELSEQRRLSDERERFATEAQSARHRALLQVGTEVDMIGGRLIEAERTLADVTQRAQRLQLTILELSNRLEQGERSMQDRIKKEFDERIAQGSREIDSLRAEVRQLADLAQKIQAQPPATAEPVSGSSKNSTVTPIDELPPVVAAPVESTPPARDLPLRSPIRPYATP
jgi:predicted  nucleic acid-binding Zn-ribbon protein